MLIQATILNSLIVPSPGLITVAVVSTGVSHMCISGTVRVNILPLSSLPHSVAGKFSLIFQMQVALSSGFRNSGISYGKKGKILVVGLKSLGSSRSRGSYNSIPGTHVATN